MASSSTTTSNGEGRRGNRSGRSRESGGGASTATPQARNGVGEILEYYSKEKLSGLRPAEVSALVRSFEEGLKDAADREVFQEAATAAEVYGLTGEHLVGITEDEEMFPLVMQALGIVK